VIQRWLGPYAVLFNLRHRRAGHLFQNRFKSILVEEERYLLELVRYIHLNPVRGRRPLVTLDELDDYRWSGHAVLLGRRDFAAQDADFVLRYFAVQAGPARRAYRAFVHAGYGRRAAPDLDGGGLRRSVGGWQVVRDLARGRERWAHDERVLGSGEFVERVVRESSGALAPAGVNGAELVAGLCGRFAPLFAVTPAEVARPSLRGAVLDARALVSEAAVREHGLTLTAVGRQLGVSKQSIARALVRAAKVRRGR
jgi:hypothetical protein